MDLQLLAPRGVIDMDDFVLDWVSSFAFKNPDIKLGYSYRTGMATRKDAEFVPTPASTPQEVAMIDNYAELAATGNAARREEFVQASLEKQEYLDAHWQAVGKRRRTIVSGAHLRSTPPTAQKEAASFDTLEAALPHQLTNRFAAFDERDRPALGIVEVDR